MNALSTGVRAGHNSREHSTSLKVTIDLKALGLTFFLSPCIRRDRVIR